MSAQGSKKGVQLFFTAVLNDPSTLQKDGKINPSGGAKIILSAPYVNPSIKSGAQDISHSARGGTHIKELGQTEFIEGSALLKVPNKNFKPLTANDSDDENIPPPFVYEMKWSKHIGCDFLFEAKQPMGVALVSNDGGTRYAITEKDFLLSQVICSSTRAKTFPLVSTSNMPLGSVTVTYVDKCVNAKDALYLQFRAEGISKIDDRKNALPNSTIPLHVVETNGKPSPDSDEPPIKPYWIVNRILPNGGVRKVAQTTTEFSKITSMSSKAVFEWPVIGPILLSDIGTAAPDEITIYVECRYVKWKKGMDVISPDTDPLIGSFATSVAAISEDFEVKGPAAQFHSLNANARNAVAPSTRPFPLFGPLPTRKSGGGGFCCGDAAVQTKSDLYRETVERGFSAIAVLSSKSDQPITAAQSTRAIVGAIHFGAGSHIYKCPNFTDYLSAGWQINLVVSIDFTASNGDPRDPNSLHFIPDARSNRAPNHYIRAIMSVGDILLEYDDDKLVPTYGFGADLGGRKGRGEDFFSVRQANERRASGNTNMPLLGESTTFDHDHANVDGVQGILNEYGAFLPTCVLSGPTNFAPTIRTVTRLARNGVKYRHALNCEEVSTEESSKPPVYTILLMITDGEITDMRETINALVEADDAPLSIVIVGVGNKCDFEAMVELDCDGGFLQHSLPSHKPRVSRRDLVQFVPFREFEQKSRESLAAEVLEEVPEQFEVYASLADAKPYM